MISKTYSSYYPRMFFSVVRRKGEVKGQKGEEGAVRKHCHESLSLYSAGCVVLLLNAVTSRAFSKNHSFPSLL